MSELHVERQRRFYESRTHAHLRARANEPYARKHATRLARGVGMQPDHRVLELGAGFGRFTFDLLEFCSSIVAVDVSRRVLDSLVRTRDERGIPGERCRPHCADLHRLSPDRLGGTFDFVVGFFLLHHLPDPARAIRQLTPLVTPGGGMAFIEPNRLNPLFLAQLALCPDMSWAQERGLLRLSAKAVGAAYRQAGLVGVEVARFGFFPPQVLNRSRAALRLEGRLEALRPLRGLLPFLLLSARVPAAGEPAGWPLD